MSTAARRQVRSAVVVSAVDPYPADSGKSVVLTGFLRHLRDRLGPENVHYIHVGGRPVADLTPFEGVTVHEVGGPRAAERIRAVVVEAGLRRRSLQETFLSSPHVAGCVRRVLAGLDADLEIVDTVRMLQHVGPPPARGRRVLYLDDLFSVRYRRMLDVIDSGVDVSGFDPLGQFGRNIPAPLRGLTRVPVTRRMLLQLESRRVARSEREAATEAELSILLNEDEAAGLRRQTGGDVAVLPPWVPQRPASAHEWDGRPEYVFMGLLSLPHNHDGVMWFLRHGLSRLLARRPDARLHIIGRDASEELLAEAARHGDHVVVHGYVEDLDEALMTRCALVNPLRFGSGVKIKTLDSLARGIPIVATAFGIEGITTTSVPGVRLVADAAEAGQALAELADPQVRARESQGAREFYDARFAEPAIRRAYDEAFGTAAS